VLAFLELASNLVLFLIPLVILPTSLLFNVEVFLRISVIFATFHLAWGTARFISSEKLFNVAWIVQVPLMLVWFGLGWLYLPSIVGYWYGGLLDWAAPALLVVEAIQMVRIFMHITYRLVSTAEADASKAKVVNFTLMAGSLVCYFAFAWFAFRLYNHPNLEVETATFLTAVVCTCILLTVIVVFFVDEGSLSDTAMLSLFLIFIARMTVHTFSAQTYDGMFGSQVKSGWNMLNYYASTGTGQMNISQLLTLDFLLATVFALATVLSFPYFHLETEDLSFHSSAMISEEDEALTRGWQKHIFGSLMVVFYSHVILCLTGHILPSGQGIRMFQALLSVVYYCYRLYKATKSDGFKED